jgi:type I restriction-modification system DNA methylase subunit
MIEYIKERCFILGVVSLPSRTFYSTPKKTYILALRRKPHQGQTQTDPVFTYLVSEIGESRDSRRVHLETNHMNGMEQEFAMFRAAPLRFKSSDDRCKILKWSDFDALRNWLVDRNWTMQEKVALGIAQEPEELDGDAFRKLVRDAKDALDTLYKELS